MLFELVVVHYLESGKPGKTTRFSIPANKEMSLGKIPLSDTTEPPENRSDWVVPEGGDKFVFGRHVYLKATNGVVQVRKAAGKLLYAAPGASVLDCEHFEMLPGQVFQIGSHLCYLIAQENDQRDEKIRTLRLDSLRDMPFANPTRHIDTVSRLVSILQGSNLAESIWRKILGVLQEGCDRAVWGAVIRLRTCPTPETVGTDILERFRSALAPESPEDFRPSISTLAQCSASKECVLKTWNPSRPSDGSLRPRRDWAIALPLPRLDEEEEELSLYMEGAVDQSDSTPGKIAAANSLLRDYQKLMETAGQILVAFRRMTDLQERLGNARNFLPSQLLRALQSRSISSLKAEEMPVSIMFCDIRGSVEIGRGLNTSLTEIRSRIESALEIMTNAVSLEGIVGDLQGDAMMGFWGWPDAKNRSDHWDQIEQGIKAARQIASQFRTIHNSPAFQSHPLRRTKCGIAIAHGRALVGVLGTLSFSKLDVFGPVANLAARLESLTKPLGVTITVDESVAKAVVEQQRIQPTLPYRVLGLGRYRPPGMDQAIDVFELLPEGLGSEGISISDRDLWEQTMAGFFVSPQHWKKSIERTTILREKSHFSHLAEKLYQLAKRFPEAPPENWKCFFDIDKAGNIQYPE